MVHVNLSRVTNDKTFNKNIFIDQFARFKSFLGLLHFNRLDLSYQNIKEEKESKKRVKHFDKKKKSKHYLLHNKSINAIVKLFDLEKKI